MKESAEATSRAIASAERFASERLTCLASLTSVAYQRLAALAMSVWLRKDRGNELWVTVRWRGKRIRQRSPVQTRRGAKQFEQVLLNELLDRCAKGLDPRVGPPPLYADFANRWLRDYATVQNRRSTVREKTSALRSRLLPAFGRLPLDEITTLRIDQTMARWREGGLSPKRIKNLLTVLRCSLRVAEEWGLIREAPRVRSVKVRRPTPVFLTPEETQRLIGALEPGFWRTLVTFMVETGVRFEEAAALQWDDLHLDGDAPHVFIQRSVEHGDVNEPKTPAGKRLIPLFPQAVEALRSHPRVSEWVFPSATGRFLHPSYCLFHLTNACARASVRRVTWHKLRHTFASTMMARGTPLAVVMELMGHSSVEMTKIYTHVAPQVARRFVAAAFSPPSNASESPLMATSAEMVRGHAREQLAPSQRAQQKATAVAVAFHGARKRT